MSGIVNQTGAKSGIIGTTVGTPAGSSLLSTTIVKHTGTNWYTNSLTPTAVHDSISFSATSGNTYRISSHVTIEIWCTTATATAGRQGQFWLYQNSSTVAENATSGFGTNIGNVKVGREISATTVGRTHYAAFVVEGVFVAASTATAYVHLVAAVLIDVHSRVLFPTNTQPHYYIIEEYTGDIFGTPIT